MGYEKTAHSCIKNDSKHGVRLLGFYFIWRLMKEPAYGYSLVQELREWTLAPPLKHSTVYMILNRLEKCGYIVGKSREVGGRMRKMYRATASGKELFNRMKKRKITGRVREFLETLLS